jgi:hypothetical protein
LTVGESKRRARKAPTLDDLIERAFDRARDRLVLGEREQPLPPTWFFVMPDGSVREGETPFADMSADPHGDMQKEAVAKGTGSWMRASGVTAYAYVSEAWAVESRDADDPRRPSERPDRIEIVVALAESADGEQRAAAWKMVRGETGRVVHLRAKEAPTSLAGDKLKGKFFGLLNKPPARWWTAENDPRTTFCIPVENLERIEREGPPPLDDKAKAKLAEFEAETGDVGKTVRDGRCVIAAWRELGVRRVSHVYPCGLCGEGGKFTFGDRPRYVAFVIPWPDPPGLDNVKMAPVCEACGDGRVTASEGAGSSSGSILGL